jgi:hypothetical protein
VLHGVQNAHTTGARRFGHARYAFCSRRQGAVLFLMDEVGERPLSGCDRMVTPARAARSGQSLGPVPQRLGDWRAAATVDEPGGDAEGRTLRDVRI